MLEKLKIGMLTISVLATVHINCMDAETPPRPQKTTVVIHPENEGLCDGAITLMLYQKGENEDEYSTSYIAPEDFKKYSILTGNQEVDDNNQRNKVATQNFLQALSQLRVTSRTERSIETTSQNYHFYIQPAIDIQPLLKYLREVEHYKFEREQTPIKSRPESPMPCLKTYNFTFKQLILTGFGTISFTALATTAVLKLLLRR